MLTSITASDLTPSPSHPRNSFEMNSAPPGTAPASLRPDLQACLRDAALALGLDAETAGRFARTGQLQAGDIGMRLQPRSDAPGDDWLSIARVARPPGFGEEHWREALLGANGQIMLLGDWGFAVDEQGAGLLVQRIPHEHCEDARMLSAHLYGALSVTSALLAGPPDSAPLQTLHDGAPSPRSAGSDTQPGDLQLMIDHALDEPAFTAEVRALLAATVACLGGDEMATRAVLDCAGMQVDGRHVDVVMDPEGEALILATALDETSARDLWAALASNVELVSLASVATARLAGRLSLIGRYRLRNASGEDLAEWLNAFAALAGAISRQPSSDALH